MEVLITLLMLAVVFTAFMGAIARAAQVSNKAARLTEALTQVDAFLFELESGMRSDLAGYGGRGQLDKGFVYRMDAQEKKDFGAYLKSRFSWKEGKEHLDLEFFVLRAPVQ